MTIRPALTPSPWAPLARDCLLAAMRSDHTAAQAAATALIHQHGPGVLPQVMLAWINTAIAAQGITPGQMGEPARMVFGDIDTGRISTDAGDVDPLIAWAGRLINSRIADDQEMYEALIGAVPDRQASRYVNALLGVCAQTVRLGRALRERLQP